MIKILLFSSLFLQFHAQDLLDQRVLDYGHFVPLYEYGSVVKAMKEVIDIMRYSISHRDLIIKFDQSTTATCIPFLEFDKRRLQQVLMNLLSNACKFTHDGVIEVYARARLCLGERNAVLIEVSVADQGIGIARKDLEYIFKPFRM